METTHGKPRNALVALTESDWLLSIVTAVQPRFANQPDDVEVIWGYGLFPEERGNHINKKMEDCTGEEILAELYHRLGYTDRLEKFRGTAACIPCMMPFITDQFIPRTPGDRPEVVPTGLSNFAFLGQFAEVPDDVVFIVEYSVRSALMTVYELFDTEGDVPSVSIHQYEPDVPLDTVRAVFG